MNYIRWATEKDIPKIADIENTVYGVYALEISDLNKIRKGKNTTIIVCDNNNRGINGYCIYNVTDTKIYIFRLVIDPVCYQNGIGTEFILKIKDKLKGPRNIIEMDVDDDNLVAHLFLKNHGFKATQVLAGGVDENDLYVFQYEGNVLSELT